MQNYILNINKYFSYIYTSVEHFMYPCSEWHNLIQAIIAICNCLYSCTDYFLIQLYWLFPYTAVLFISYTAILFISLYSCTIYFLIQLYCLFPIQQNCLFNYTAVPFISYTAVLFISLYGCTVYFLYSCTVYFLIQLYRLFPIQL